MDSKQIYTILANDSFIKDQNFLGVFPIDLIPMTALKFPCCLVVNTKPQDHKGEHWVAIVKTEDRKGIYFDSFGMPPYNLPEVGDVLENCTEWTFNNTRLQSSFSTVCGQYVLFFLTHYARGFTLEHIVNLLNNDRDLHANDALIYNYVKHKYAFVDKLSQLEIIDFPFIFNQISSQPFE